MDSWNNYSGSTPAPSGGSPKFDPYSLAGQLIGTFIQIGFAKDNAKQQRELQEKIAKLSLESQENIAKALANAQTSIEKQRIGFQILSLEKNEVLLRDLQKDKTTSLIFVGLGTLALAVVIFLVKIKKRNG
jgi:NADH/NAD ratio-sensing transcriptional regulator Rex